MYSDLLVAPALLELGETPSAVQNRVGGGRGLIGRGLHLAFSLPALQNKRVNNEQEYLIHHSNTVHALEIQ